MKMVTLIGRQSKKDAKDNKIHKIYQNHTSRKVKVCLVQINLENKFSIQQCQKHKYNHENIEESLSSQEVIQNELNVDGYFLQVCTMYKYNFICILVESENKKFQFLHFTVLSVSTR